MATSIGHMDPFDDSSETFELYIERFEMFIVANGITEDDKKKATFLSLIGPKTYGLLRSLTTPDKPKDKTFEALTQLLKNHLSPPPLEIAETYRFHQRNQLHGETVNEYIAKLKSLSEHCNFHANYRSRVLRDRFVCGMSSDNTRRKLLSEADLTLDRALELARSMEQADKDLQSMTIKSHGGAPTIPVSSLTTDTKTQLAPVASLDSTRRPCRSCGSSLHLRKNCPHLQSECYGCGLKGHLQSVCERKGSDSSAKPKHYKTQSARRSRSTHALGKSSETADDESEEVAHIYSISSPKVPAIMLKTLVNGKEVEMELDTGASVSTMPYSTYRRVCPEVRLEQTNITLKPYGLDKKLIPKGKLTTTLQYQGQESQVSMYVIGEDNEVPLFGRDLLAHFKLDWPDIGATVGEKFSSLVQCHSWRVQGLSGTDQCTPRGITRLPKVPGGSVCY